MKPWLIFMLLHFSLLSGLSQGIIVNEFSNGASGAQEYFELVAVGPQCTTIDIRNWIIDDNNGDFSGGPSTGEGIAQGHIRFNSDLQWSAVSVGSIILVYNSSDKNTSILLGDDETDSNGDSVYVLPHTSSLLEYCTLRPNTSDAGYSPCTYSSPSAWTSIGLRNTGDAAQVRDNSGNYFHGLSYGANPMTGGPDGLKLSNTVGDSRVGFFDNSGSNNYRAISNFSFMNVSGNESPGEPNTVANANWIKDLRESCPLDASNIELFAELEESAISLFFDINFNYNELYVEKYITEDWQSIAEVKQNLYRDLKLFYGLNSYRIRAVNDQGENFYSNIETVYVYSLENDIEYEIYSLLGQRITEDYLMIDKGLYIIKSNSKIYKMYKN